MESADACTHGWREFRNAFAQTTLPVVTLPHLLYGCATPVSDGDSNLYAMLRLGTAVAWNVLLILFFPKLAMWSGDLANTQKYLIFGSLAGATVLILVPVVKSKEPGYRISAIMLCLLPAAVLAGCVWRLLS